MGMQTDIGISGMGVGMPVPNAMGTGMRNAMGMSMQNASARNTVVSGGFHYRMTLTVVSELERLEIVKASGRRRAACGGNPSQSCIRKQVLVASP